MTIEQRLLNELLSNNCPFTRAGDGSFWFIFDLQCTTFILRANETAEGQYKVLEWDTVPTTGPCQIHSKEEE